VHPLRTFFSHRIQPLRGQRTKMWMYPRPSYPDCPSFEELSAVEVEDEFLRSWISGSTRTTVLTPFPYGEGLLVLGLVHQTLFHWLS
jgi:hypothetical protein